MTTKITITIHDAVTPEYHTGIVNTIQFMAQPFAGKWQADIAVEDLEEQC